MTLVQTNDAQCPQCGHDTARVRVHKAARVAVTCARCRHTLICSVETLHSTPAVRGSSLARGLDALRVTTAAQTDDALSVRFRPPDPDPYGIFTAAREFDRALDDLLRQ
jgi:transcription elongation factor Elf1